jgi:hypothetical protein
METRIDEPISVGAVFKAGKIKPVWFEWRGKRYWIDRVNFFWISMQGESKIYSFSLQGKTGDVYQICFNSKYLLWRLNSIWVGNN